VSRLCKHVTLFLELANLFKHWYFKVTDDVTGIACGLLGLCGIFEGNSLAHMFELKERHC
jgi:hypothetical protein